MTSFRLNIGFTGWFNGVEVLWASKVGTVLVLVSKVLFQPYPPPPIIPLGRHCEKNEHFNFSFFFLSSFFPILEDNGLSTGVSKVSGFWVHLNRQNGPNILNEFRRVCAIFDIPFGFPQCVATFFVFCCSVSHLFVYLFVIRWAKTHPYQLLHTVCNNLLFD